MYQTSNEGHIKPILLVSTTSSNVCHKEQGVCYLQMNPYGFCVHSIRLLVERKRHLLNLANSMPIITKIIIFYNVHCVSSNLISKVSWHGR